ncbi:carbohydrate-binding domain-containing protein [Paenibacillus glycanilyticus]|uniref:carbohydrate-binding domain-containing protein n=1 Tax=Paenibacillus glycanilyticus TaxID=126569 RepID=UPI000FD6DA6F|nr:carbohydrate-binding domain-containing protein [Paenibacillus glycanilyticus]
MNNKKRLSKLAFILLCAAALSACNSQTNAGANTTGSTGSANTSEAAAAVQTATYQLDDTVEYDEDDAYTDWSTSDVTSIALNGTSATIDGSGAEAKDGILTITAAGTYVASGKLDEGQIVVNVADKGIVRLVLNGAEIHYSKSAPIYVEEAGKLILSLPEGTNNVVSDGTDYVFPDSETDEPNAAIFSKDDMTINGTGKLTVQGNYNNGIASKDKLKITGGTFDIQAADDAVMGRDLVAVKDGDFTLDAAGHGIKTTNDTEGEEGIIVLQGGTYNIQSGKDGLHSTGGLSISEGDLTIAAGDDGIHAETALEIAGGNIDITKSYEGLEATDITIAGGDIKLAASDDGVNAATGADSSGGEGAAPGGGQQASGASEGLLTISGGSLYVDADGDGLDANGSIVMTGGTVMVNGPTENNNGALDYDSTFNMTGGTLVAAGSSGMVQAASDSSTQAGILMMFPETQQAGTLVHLEDESGKAIATYAPTKNYQAVYISTPDLAKDASYTIYSGGKSTGTPTNGLYADGEYSGGTKVVSFTASSLITWVNESGVTEAQSGFGGGMGGGRGGHGGMGGGGGRGMGGQMPQDGAAPPDGTAPGGTAPQNAPAATTTAQ